MPEQTSLPHRVMKVPCKHCITGIDAEFPDGVTTLRGVTCPTCGASYTIERVDDGGNYEAELGRLAYRTTVTTESTPGDAALAKSSLDAAKVYGAFGPTDAWAERTIDPTIPRASDPPLTADEVIRRVHEVTRDREPASGEGLPAGVAESLRPKACPFCGKDAGVERTKDWNDPDYPRWIVRCADGDCAAEGPGAITMTEAVDRWNNRRGHHFTRQQVAMLRRAIMVYRNRMQSLGAGQSGEWDEISVLLEAQLPPEVSDA